MSQSNLAIQPPQEEPFHSPQKLKGTEQPANSPSTSPVLKVGKQSARSPEQQAKVEKISRVNPYVGLQRDEHLFTALNHWRSLGICGRVTTMDRLGLAKSLQFYTQLHIKRRGSLLLTPAPVAYVEIEQYGSPTDLFLTILDFLVNPLDCGHLRQLRSRTWGTLKTYKVEILIINNADLLSFAAFNELVRIAEKLEISIVLAGSPYLDEILDSKSPNKKKYVTIHNTFLKYHPYNTFGFKDVPTFIEQWETALGWSEPLDLKANEDIVKLLSDASQGQLRPLYENLREIAVWKVDHPRAQINPQNISQALGICHQPISRL